MRTRVGKIARLPHEVREEVCRRLRDGEMGKTILAWLNGLPEVKQICGEHFNSPIIDDENLRAWRAGGYQEWLGRHDRLDHTRELAAFAAKLATANGSTIAEGGAAIASGRLLELLEATSGKLEPEELGEIISGLTNLRKVEVQQERADIAQARLKQIDEALALEREKFQRTTCELFLKWHSDERARSITEGPGTNAEKIEKLGEAMFGELWK